MAILGPAMASSAGTQPAFRLGVDMTSIVNRVSSPAEARELPRGAVVGDLHGGLTFSDTVAIALESRSRFGWQEIELTPGGERWTVIVLDR
jgi:hypothetical protein